MPLGSEMGVDDPASSTSSTTDSVRSRKMAGDVYHVHPCIDRLVQEQLQAFPGCTGKARAHGIGVRPHQHGHFPSEDSGDNRSHGLAHVFNMVIHPGYATI